MLLTFLPNQVFSTDIFGYSDTIYSDTPLTVTVLVNPMLPKSVSVFNYLLTVTLFPFREGVTETGDVCKEFVEISFHQHQDLIMLTQ